MATQLLICIQVWFDKSSEEQTEGDFRMQALWLDGGKLFLRTDLEWPQPGPAEALLRMRTAGICGTDLQLLSGYSGFVGIPGHEFVAEVIESPSDTSWEGRRVVGEINVSCDRCRFCRNGNANHCRRRRVLGIRSLPGCFAERFVLPLKNLHPVPDDLVDRVAVFSEPLAAALGAAESTSVKTGDKALVLGGGKLGQLIARILVLRGCRVWVSVRHPRQRVALEGIDAECIEPSRIPQAKMDLVVDASGTPEGFGEALKAVRPRGTVVLKSTYSQAGPLNLSPIVVHEVRVVGSRCGPLFPALRHLAEGLVDPLPLVDARFPLAQGAVAVERASRPGTLKVLIENPLVS